MENVEKTEEQKAQELLQKKEQEKLESFQTEYNELCKKYGYGMAPVVKITQNGVVPGLEILKIA